MKRIVHLTLIVLVLSSCTNSNSQRKDKFSLSNSIVEVLIDRVDGEYSFVDLASGDTIIRSAAMRCDIDRDYSRRRDRIKIFSHSEGTGKHFSSNDPMRINKVKKGKTDDASFITLSSSLEGENTLFITFTIYDNQSTIDISWGYENLSDLPVQVNKTDVLYGAEAFSNGNESDEYFILDGNGGGPHNKVNKMSSVLSYNNLLLTRKSVDHTQNIVIGGLVYNDYVKFAEIVDPQAKVLSLYGEDPVGKRIDSDGFYQSPDKFYIEFSSSDPFMALELYGKTLKEAQNVDLAYYTFPSVCMWFLSVQHFGGDVSSTNDTPGAVQEMKNAVNSGFLKYSPVCIRLVPDNYEQNNEQGWWDDEHWQMYGRKERCIVEGGHYKAPYETTEKWAGEIRRLGGIPITYIEPGVRSEDYADAYPDHMLFNEAHRYILRNGKEVVDPHQIMGAIYGKMYQENFDYTDTGFIDHIEEVYDNLRAGGVRGSFYDYPERAFPILGGMDDKYSTAAAHYRSVFQLAYDGFGENPYIQERNIGLGSDITLGVVASQRTQGDNNILRPEAVRSAGLRWYKNRSVVNYDMDGKALLVKGSKQNIPISKEERRAILTMSYTVTGRLLLTESFSRFNSEVLYDLSRIYPFHSTELSPRPIDAFVSEIPHVFDFRISPQWHQLVLYNDDTENNKVITIPLAGDLITGSLGLDSSKEYHMYNFWDDEYSGLYKGAGSINQNLRIGEARVLSIHEKLDRPQFISTNRHILQGYVDMPTKPVWDGEKLVLSGTSSVIQGESYSIVIALNAYSVENVIVQNADCEFEVFGSDNQLLRLNIVSSENQDVKWEIKFIL